MKKILSVMLTLALLLSVMSGVAFAAEPSAEVAPDYAWYGNGEAVEYTLSDVGDLFGFADIVNGKAIIDEAVVKDSFNGKTVRLNADIDLTGMVWTPIGASMYSHAASADATKKFEGTFDGQNHTVTGLSSDGYVPLSEDATVEYSFGLFGYAYGATIRNVNLADVSIDCCTVEVAEGTKSVDGSGVAALVGFYVSKDGAVSVIENCHVLSGTVTATNNMGGLLGFLQVQGNNETVDVTVKSCSNAADVTTMAREAGGVLGLAQLNADDNATTGVLKFENCTNSGDVTAEKGGSVSCAGGILGWENTIAYDADIYIVFENCTNAGAISAIGKNTEIHAAGIGSVNYSRGPWLAAYNCKNTGIISATNGDASDSFAGGIFALSPFVTLENCTTTETVSALDNTTAAVVGKVSGAGFLCVSEGALVTVNEGSIFMLNGGITQAPAKYASLSGRDTYRPSDPTRTSFSFGGWYKTEGLEYQTPNYSAEPATEFPSGHTYHAKWIPVAPTVTISGATENGITLTATHPVDGVSYTWYKNGELISGETGSSLEVESTAERVTYTAKATKDAVDSDFSNSIIVYDEVKAAMKAATEELVVGEYSGTYDGETHNITVSCGENDVAYYKDAGCSIVTDGFKDAGTYPVYYKISVPVGNETYYLGGGATVTIAKAKVTVTADNKTAEVGEDQPALTYTAVGFVGEDTFIAEPTCIALDVDMESAGSYAITVSGGTVSGNYELEYVSGTLSVTNPPVPIPVYTARVPAGISISPAHPWPGVTVIATMTDENMDGVRVVDSKGNSVRVNVKDRTFSFVMPAGNVEIVPFELQFTDISESDYYSDALLWALANGITDGTSDTTFSPAASCTRAQMVTFLWRAAGCPKPTAAGSDFTDVDPDSYYAKAALWAAETGITQGTGEGMFSPDMECSRAQMAAFLCRMTDGKAESDESAFDDVKADAYYAASVQWAVESGITEGTGEGKYSPDASCTRGQMVTFLYRYYAK